MNYANIKNNHLKVCSSHIYYYKMKYNDLITESLTSQRYVATRLGYNTYLILFKLIAFDVFNKKHLIIIE